MGRRKMTTKPSLKDLWIQRINDWKASGKTIQSWCKENGLREHQLYYWRRKTASVDKSASFIEIKEAPPEKTTVSLSYGGFEVCLERSFDEETLLRCLKVLKRV
jgi:transposase-like protein